MKIYVLRHEKRYKDHTFFSELILEGKEDAIKLKETLKELNIDEIYCSPYIRIIQTIEPYLKELKKYINIEYSLYECLTTDKNCDNIKNVSNEIVYGNKYYNNQYIPFLDSSKLKFGESYDDMKNRSMNFLINKIKNNKNCKKNILFVSHMSTINCMLNRDPMEHYRQGLVTKIYDSDLTDSDNSNCFITLN
jgi:broad specificity phosphatase PhoE